MKPARILAGAAPLAVLPLGLPFSRALAAVPSDPSAPVRTCIDAFKKGDVKTAVATSPTPAGS